MINISLKLNHNLTKPDLIGARDTMHDGISLPSGTAQFSPGVTFPTNLSLTSVRCELTWENYESGDVSRWHRVKSVSHNPVKELIHTLRTLVYLCKAIMKDTRTYSLSTSRNQFIPW